MEAKPDEIQAVKELLMKEHAALPNDAKGLGVPAKKLYAQLMGRMSPQVFSACLNQLLLGKQAQEKGHNYLP